MTVCDERIKEIRAEIDLLAEKNMDKLSSPEVVGKARKIESRLSEIA